MSHPDRSRADASPSELVVTCCGLSHTARPGDGAITIGRDLPAQIRVPDPRMSRIHLRIEVKGTSWVLVDAGSTNGVFVNGDRVSSAAITDGLTAHLGHPDGIPVMFEFDSTTTSSAQTGGTEGRGMSTAVHPGSTTGVVVADDEDSDDTTDFLSDTVRISVLVDAVEIALKGINARVVALPPATGDEFGLRATGLLAELRRLEGMLANAAGGARSSPEVAVLLGEVRRTFHALMDEAARGPAATVGQKLYAARHRAQLSPAEVARAAGVDAAEVVDCEAGRPVSANATAALEAVIAALSSR